MNDQSGSGGQTAGSSGAGPGRGDGEQQAQPPLVIQAQYVKDLSFEVPGAPQIFAQLQKTRPDMQVRVEVQSHPIAERIHEVVLSVRADCTVNNAKAFVVELAYGGVFAVNVPEESVRPVLMIECPRLLFPFARQVIASATLDGGFLPLMLAPIDFVQLYQRQMQQRLQEQQEEESRDKLA